MDIGGEDSKMIFFAKGKSPDMRMNGSCAGGTGSFIDQMTTLLNVDMEEFNRLAENSTTIYPIASRCGVFQNRRTKLAGKKCLQRRYFRFRFHG